MDSVADLRRRNVMPFLVVAVGALGTLLLPPYAEDHRLWQLLVAVAAAAVTGVLALVTVRLPATHPLVAVPPLTFLAVAGLAEYAAGGDSWGLAPLVILPVLWFVLYGTRTQLLLSALGAAAFFLVPLLLVGPPMYPSSGWRRAVTWLLVITVVCPILQRAVGNLRRAAEQQRRSAERWRSLVSLLPDTTVLVVGEDLRYHLAVGAETDKRDDPVEGRRVDEVSEPGNAAVLTELYRGALDGRAGSVELVAASGTLVHLDAVPLRIGRDEGGPRREALVVSHDVTEARTREQALHRALSRFGRLFDETPHGTFILTATEGITQVNPALCALLGATPEELVGARLDALPFGLGVAAPLLQQLLGPDGPTRLNVDTTLVLPDRAAVDVSLTAVALDLDDEGHTSLLVTLVDVSERTRYEQRLAELADQDPLTGLANRRKFDATLAEHLERSRRYGTGGALLLLDLDDFKQVNDTLGHGVGDQIIKSVASLLRTRMRAVDLVARLGGDEFAVLLADEDRAGAEVVARDVITLIREKVRVLDGRRPRGITASLGVVMLEDGPLSPGELVSTADMVMYDAKDAGRDQYLVHDTSVHAVPRTGARLAWLERIARALHDEAFVVRAQPVVDVTTRRVVGAELLIRMVDEAGGLVLPGTFLYIAERSELIRDIDMLMAGHAVRLLEQAQRIAPDFCVEVNLSGHSVGSERLADHISTLVRDADIDPHGLVFEITETAAVSDIGQARTFAERLHSLGCRFALDDFGAGFGSFYYLKHLLFDYIKIDGEFVLNCATNPTDRLIVSSVVDIAHGLGKQTIAEFVADEEVLRVVEQLGVDMAQGFHVGKPDTVEALLHRVRDEVDQARVGARATGP